MWIKIVLASILSGILMGLFVGFGYRNSSGMPICNLLGSKNNTSFGNWIRKWRCKLFNNFQGWKIVVIRFFGLFGGMFGPLYVFFYLPLFPCRLTDLELGTYLVFGMVFLKGTDLL